MDWRQRSGCSSEGERSTRLSSEGRGPLVTLADLSASPSVFSGRRTTLQKGSPPQKKDICKLYSYFTQTLPSENKNINYILTYLRLSRCLSSGTICDSETLTPSAKKYSQCIPRPPKGLTEEFRSNRKCYFVLISTKAFNLTSYMYILLP